ncbi:Sporulation initiation inhibitor protein Soj [termite gut metagenome]|uniref:Sporulation initiation inhibitor protein Soj n=1 Tax=termite gut metagenome TaxID=433724 RepID=A0A5J4QLU9_9ZZZZ
MGKTISIINHKGGVGKTTTTVSLASGLCLLNKKVLLIDIDPQANLTISTGLNPSDEKNIYGALSGKYPLPIITTDTGLDVVPSTIDLSAAEIELHQKPEREALLKKLIYPVLKNYDFVLIDCPPSLGLLTLNALTASQGAIIPVELSGFALAGMAKLFEIVKKVRQKINPELTICRILITRMDKRQAVQKELSDYIYKTYGNDVLKSQIRNNAKIIEAQIQRKDIFTFYKTSNGAKDYMNLCKEFLKIYKNKNYEN